jgi:hypothetical protein
MTARTPGQKVTVLEDTSWERLWSSEASRLLTLARPWATLGLVWAAGWGAHRAWGKMPAVPWAVAGLTLACVGLAAYTWQASRLAPVGRAHSTATAAAAVTWLTIATITGPIAHVTGYLLAVAGAVVSLTWNIRHHMRHHIAQGTADPAGRLSEWFKDAAKDAGLPGAKLQVQAIEPTRAEAKAILPPGKTAADMQQRVRAVESAGQVPPGTLTAAEDPDRADHVRVMISDPRLIRDPVPHPGPSLPGVSISHPLRPGIWQDGAPVQHVLPGHHVHIMGSSGAGKSEGGCWCYCGEIMTRPDAAIVAADITKATQTFGPLAVALHRFETTRDGVRDMLNRLHKLVPERTAYLADHGLTKWVEGCGLSYLVAWLEEVPDIYDALTGKEQDHFQSDVKALRSAGGSFVLSLQRSTWDQIPTLVRGQMASMCFGLYKDSDERYGLSEKQHEMGATPSSWGTDHPGMAYLHAPGTPPDRIAMPMRTYAWGDISSKARHDETAAAAMAEYAAQFPAQARPVDALTAALVGGNPSPASVSPAAPARPVTVLTAAPVADDDGQADDDETENEANVCDEYLTIEDPSPDLVAGIDDPIEMHPDDEPFEFERPAKMTPEAARAAFAEQLDAWRAEGRTTFAPRDLRPLMERTGMSRAWVQARLREAVEASDGPIERDDDGGIYRLRAA